MPRHGWANTSDAGRAHALRGASPPPGPTGPGTDAVQSDIEFDGPFVALSLGI
jgi:hypothetical protein